MSTASAANAPPLRVAIPCDEVVNDALLVLPGWDDALYANGEVRLKGVSLPTHSWLRTHLIVGWLDDEQAGFICRAFVGFSDVLPPISASYVAGIGLQWEVPVRWLEVPDEPELQGLLHVTLNRSTNTVTGVLEHRDVTQE